MRSRAQLVTFTGDSLVAYARTFTYDASAGDSQRLMLGAYPNGRYGPRVKIEPVLGAYAWDSATLAKGVPVARLINADSVPYPKLNLEALDTVYWFIGAGELPLGSTLVSTRNQNFVRYVTRRHREARAAQQSMARFVWNDADEGVWVYCLLYECCRAGE